MLYHYGAFSPLSHLISTIFDTVDPFHNHALSLLICLPLLPIPSLCFSLQCFAVVSKRSLFTSCDDEGHISLFAYRSPCCCFHGLVWSSLVRIPVLRCLVYMSNLSLRVGGPRVAYVLIPRRACAGLCMLRNKIENTDVSRFKFQRLFGAR